MPLRKKGGIEKIKIIGRLLFRLQQQELELQLQVSVVAGHGP
jgi:hypothetical protein